MRKVIMKRSFATILGFILFLAVMLPVTTVPVLASNQFLASIQEPVAGSIPISTADELKYIGKDKSSLNKAYYLTNDIDLKGVDWVPIAFDSNGPFFSGVLDGQGHVIKNMNINSTSYEKVGLFGEIGSKATIYNLGMEDVKINLSWSAGISDILVGAIVGKAEGTITNCYVTGSIAAEWNGKTPEDNKSIKIGGLVGEGTGDCIVTNSYNRAEILVKNCHFIIGGVLGGSGSQNSNVPVIANCYNTGKITALFMENGQGYIGGVVGDYRGDILSCYNHGNIFVDEYRSGSTNNVTIGGVVGIYTAADGNNGSGTKFTNCYNIAEISCVGGNSPIVGGIVGQSDIIPEGVQISKSCNFGSINIEKAANAFAGGIAGIGNVSSCYNTAKITAAAQEWVYVGGIVGRGGYSVINSYNTGTVSAISATTTAEHNTVCSGGIIGELDNSERTLGTSKLMVNNCYFLKNSAKTGIGRIEEKDLSLVLYEKREEEIKTLVTELGDAFVDTGKEKNNGYPILKWESEGDDSIFAVKGIQLSEKSLTLNQGEPKEINVRFLPENATNKSIIWKSSNELVASGGEIVWGSYPGTATITATTVDGRKIAECKITVKGITLSRPKVTLNKSSKTSIKLKWNKIPDAEGYEIYRAAPGGDYKLIKSLKAVQSFNNTKLSANTTYYYMVRAKGKGGYSDFSVIQSLKLKK